MDFLVGILLTIILILMIYNFSSISISDSPSVGRWNNQNYLISSMQQSIVQPNINGINIPQPNAAKASTSNNASVSSNHHIYDYNKYFFVK